MPPKIVSAHTCQDAPSPESLECIGDLHETRVNSDPKDKSRGYACAAARTVRINVNSVLTVVVEV